MKRIIILAVLTLLVNVALAHAKTENSKIFGSCAVQTRVDDFSDERTPQLICLAEEAGPETFGLGLACSPQGTLTWLVAGIQFTIDHVISVVYRFDKGILYEEIWRKTSHSTATSFNPITYGRILSGIEHSKRMVFKVGSSQGTINLTGVVAPAVAEYRRRCGGRV